MLSGDKASGVNVDGISGAKLRAFILIFFKANRHFLVKSQS